jgi:hypothetical protein
MFHFNVEALSTPIPAAPNPKEQHKMAGVNQAYSIETSGEEVQMNHDSWDDSENESQMQQSHGHQSGTDTKTTKRELVMDRSWEANHKPQRTKGNNDGRGGVMEIAYGNHHFNTNQNFENCCLIQVAEGAFDDRLLIICNILVYSTVHEDLKPWAK